MPELIVPLNIIKLIMVDVPTKNSLPPAIISTKPLSFVELVHTINIDSSKTEKTADTNS